MAIAKVGWRAGFYRTANYPGNKAKVLAKTRYFSRVGPAINGSSVPQNITAVYVSGGIIGSPHASIADLTGLFGHMRTSFVVFPRDAVNNAIVMPTANYVHVAFFRGRSDAPFLIVVAKPKNARKLKDAVIAAMKKLGGTTKKAKFATIVIKNALRSQKLHV